jgi:uncharacterized membrane protein
MKKLLYSIILLLLLLTSAYADSFFLVPKKEDVQFRFGDTRILLRYDNTALFRPAWLDGLPIPESLTLKIFKQGKLVGKYFGMGFDEIYASQDNLFFLGISNSGLCQPAYIVLDCDGNILTYQRHSPDKIKYYEKSITILRQWTAHDSQDVKFEVVGGKLRGVSVMDTSHSRISLDLRPLDDSSRPQNFAGDIRQYVSASIITVLLLFVIGITVLEVRKLLKSDTQTKRNFVAICKIITNRCLPWLVGLFYVINITVYASLSRRVFYKRIWSYDETLFNNYILIFWGLIPSIVGVVLIFMWPTIRRKVFGWVLFCLGVAGLAISFNPWFSKLQTYLQ